VFLPGFKKNPYAYMTHADLFVLPSRWEGFGHVIAEAMACEVAVLSTRCPSGPDEIITNGKDGQLCDHSSASNLASHIQQLYEAPDIRKQYVVNALESVKKFEKKTIVRQYENLFRHLIGLEDKL
jgi:glycosyltransferase involved in cell wall biosynthesis